MATRPRTNSRTLHVCAAWSAALAITLGPAGVAESSSAVGGGQFVGGVVEEQFGVAVAPDGTIQGDSSTIAVKVTRTVENGIPVITIAPTD